MRHSINKTHDPALTSWVDSANDTASEFPIQNLPFGVFRRKGALEAPRVGVAIGDRVLDVSAARASGVFKGDAATAAKACESPSLNLLLGLGHTHWSALRKRLSQVLRSGSPDQSTLERVLIRMDDAELLVPASIGDYTDFYASVYHASNVGSLFRPDNPLLPNYKYVPIGYHGRASSIVASGTPVRRPVGQTKDDSAQVPSFGPSRNFDYELEVGFFVGPGNEPGTPIPIDTAEEHIFGLCLVNDWSARDIQKWEYQPLGPFLAKNFATTVSPWVVTLEALAPFRIPTFQRPAGDPQPLPYLASVDDQQLGGVDVTLQVFLRSSRMRQENLPPVGLSEGNFRDMYWTIAQVLTHHASNGCNLRPGDLLASGTVSGKEKGSRGCLLELTWRGTEPLRLPTGEERRFLEDGDEVTLRGFCSHGDFRKIGFGECSGIVLPAVW